MMERAISLAPQSTHRERRGERVRWTLSGRCGVEEFVEVEEALAKIPKSGPRRGLPAGSTDGEGALTIDTSDVWDPTKGHLGAASSDR